MTFWQILIQYCKFLMPRPLKRGILGASTIILSKDIDKYSFMCGSNFYESDVRESWATGRGVKPMYAMIDFGLI